MSLCRDPFHSTPICCCGVILSTLLCPHSLYTKERLGAHHLPTGVSPTLKLEADYKMHFFPELGLVGCERGEYCSTLPGSWFQVLKGMSTLHLRDSILRMGRQTQCRVLKSAMWPWWPWQQLRLAVQVRLTPWIQIVTWVFLKYQLFPRDHFLFLNVCFCHPLGLSLLRVLITG